ncbi:MAG: hypothetical protein ACLS9K_14020 [Lachnospira eligens]
MAEDGGCISESIKALRLEERDLFRNPKVEVAFEEQESFDTI